jgi:hypothetical protein
LPQFDLSHTTTEAASSKRFLRRGDPFEMLLRRYRSTTLAINHIAATKGPWLITVKKWPFKDRGQVKVTSPRAEPTPPDLAPF